MRALPADEVLGTLRANTMIVDNYVIPEDPAIVFAEGRHNKVDVLMGGNFADLAFGGGGAPDPASNASDRVFWVARRIAEYAREAGQEAWVYWFARNGAGSDDFLPVHASEVKYVFDNLGELTLFPDTSDPELVAASTDDQRLADQMASYWVNFARTGNPNGEGLPAWPAHTGLDQINGAVLDASPSSRSLPSAASMQALDEGLATQLEALQ